MKKTVEKNAVQNKSVSASSSGVTKKGQKSRSSVSFGDRPLFVDDKEGGWTLWTPEGRHLADFLRWSTSFKSVGRSKEFAGCVHALLTRDLAVSFLKKNYPELCRDKHFEDMLGKFERNVMKINEDYVNMNMNMSKVASKLCDAYHKTFGDYEFADDDQAQDVTRLIRYHTVYYKMDKSHKKLLDDVFPEISSGFHRTTTRKTTTTTRKTTMRKTTTRPQIPSPISSCGTFGSTMPPQTSGFAT
jgi:hypothetical protein